MNIHSLLFSGVESRRNYNIDLAKEALLFARSIIPINSSYTQTALTDRALINKLYKQIKQNRALTPTLYESLYLLLIKWDDFRKMTSKKHTRIGKLSHLENCGILSHLAANFLKKKNIPSVEIVEIEKSDHVFVIIDRARRIDGDINNVNSWGDTCIILDVLNNEIYGRGELYQKLKCYQYDKKKDNPHVLSPFLKTNKLEVIKSFVPSIDPIENQEIHNKFLEKLKIILGVLEDHSDSSDDVAQLMQKIRCFESETYDLKNITNIAMERLLDKKIRVIVREMDKLAILNKEELYLDVVINISNLYTTTLQYLK
jgi:hypothetical protein